MLKYYFHPVLPVKNLKKKPVPLQVGEEKVVLFRDKEGRPAAVLDRCPHRFTPLSLGQVKNGRITCPYHGWNFDRIGQGDQPFNKDKGTNCRVKSFQIVEKHGYLWIADHSVSLDSFPHLQCDDWHLLAAYPLEYKAPLHVVLDNFSEDEHFPFVHKILGWDEKGLQDVEFESQLHEDQITVSYRGPQRKFWNMRLLGMKPGTFLNNKWVTRFDPIRTTFTVHMTDKNNELASPGYSRLVIFFVPAGKDKTIQHIFQFTRFENKKWEKFLPFMKYGLVSSTRNDIMNDVKFTEKLASLPQSLKGMALDKFDKPIIDSRKLLDKIYYRKGHSESIPPQIFEISSNPTESTSKS